jgi:hypothetical protein
MPSAPVADIKSPIWGDNALRLERRISATRPNPPDDVGEDVPQRFVP